MGGGDAHNISWPSSRVISRGLARPRLYKPIQQCVVMLPHPPTWGSPARLAPGRPTAVQYLSGIVQACNGDDGFKGVGGIGSGVWEERNPSFAASA